MKKVLIIFILVVSLNMIFINMSASNKWLHSRVAKRIFQELYKEFISIPGIDESDIRKGDLLRDFELGSEWPDLYQIGDFLDKFPLYENKVSGKLWLNFHTKSVHRIDSVFNSIELDNLRKTKPNDFGQQLFRQLGVLSHVLEDMYCDLFWQGTLSDEYGFGDFSNFYNWTVSDFLDINPNPFSYNVFCDVERFIDNFGLDGYNLYHLPTEKSVFNMDDTPHYNVYSNIDHDLFRDIFGYSGYSNIFKRYWHNEGYANFEGDSSLQVNAFKELFSIIKTHINNDGKMMIELDEIPSIFFHSAEESLINANNLLKDTWSAWNPGRMSLNETIKKSLISQLYDEMSMNYNILNYVTLKNKYISIPEIQIYGTYWKHLINGISDTIEVYGNKHIKYLTYNEKTQSIKGTIELFSSININGDGA